MFYKDSTNRHANVETVGEAQDASTKSYRQLRNAESRINSFYQGKSRQCVVLYQAFSPDDTHTSNIIQSEHVVILMCLAAHAYAHVHIH